MHRHRATLLATVCLFSLASPFAATAQTPVPPADSSAPAAPEPAPAAPVLARHVAHHRAAVRPAPQLAPSPLAAGDTIQAIRIVGNARIEEGTILSYMLVQPGDAFSGDRVDKSLRTLYATGLFADVALRREGSTLVVTVLENPLVASINFEGNHNVKEEDLRKELTMKPRAVFSVREAQQDRQKMLTVYASKGRFAATVEPLLVRLPQNRVKVIFKVAEGPKTTISRVSFVGNHVFDESTLRGVVDSRESRWWKFLSSSDEFNPSRVDFDKELLRRFYLSKGYADFEVTNIASELSPDRKEFFVTFQVNEGEKYHVGKVEIKSEVPKLSAEPYRRFIDVHTGDVYNGDKVEKDGDLIENGIREDNVVFVKVEPKILRNAKTHTVDLQFNIAPGPRVYIERIDIGGNTVTRDNVLRREFQFAEGDPQDPTLIRYTKQRLNDLGYFSDVKVTPKQGSAPDRSIVDVQVVERATGELSLGGGYSTTSGVLGQAGLRQHNLIGTGIDAGLNGTIASQQDQLDLSATDPYFLERNLVAGVDVFYLNNNNRYVSDYSEQRIGTSFRLGYAYNNHITQAWTYQIVDRDVGNLQSSASTYVQDEAGWSVLSQIGQTLTFDWRDSRLQPHSGFVVRAGTDFAGLGGDEHFVRAKVDASYYIPLESIFNNPDYLIATSAGGGHLLNFQGNERIIDRFFLGGDNLRGFLDQGVGPHSVGYTECAGSVASPLAVNKGQQVCSLGGYYRGADSLGGNTIWTASAEFRFPLPVSKDFGLSGRAFVDAGGLFGLKVPSRSLNACDYTLRRRLPNGQVVSDEYYPLGSAVDDHGNLLPGGGTRCYYDSTAPRLSAGVGVSWKSPFGLINIDLGVPLLKQPYDQLQVFRFGFGTRFQ